MTWTIIRDALGDVGRDTSCLYFAAAAKAVLPGWKFAAGGAFLCSSQMSGWGLSVSPRDQTYSVSASETVDPDDGGYCGHCWVECGPKGGVSIIDLMEGYYGPRTCLEPTVVYHRVPNLTQSIRAYHAARLKVVTTAARRNPAFTERLQTLATQAMQASAAVR